MAEWPVMQGSDVYTVREIARAAGVSVRRVSDLIANGQANAHKGLVSGTDAVRLVRVLGGRARLRAVDRPVVTLAREPRRRTVASLAASGLLHAGLLALIALVASLGLLAARDTEQVLPSPSSVHLVFLMEPGPGGGGGGGGAHTPAPPPPAQRHTPHPVKISSPAPPVRHVVPPPRPIIAPPPPPPPPPRVEEARIERPIPPPPQVVNAPIVPTAANPVDSVGTLDERAKPAPPANGPGAGGGVGTGAGTGVGEGSGNGIGPGTGGGTGGGPFQPGSGIDPPTLLREVKPLYTDEARRQGLEGAVMLEIVVQRDGTVGSVRVERTLGAGLERKAIDAVKQWRFAPARRQGTPVDVVVQVSVDFTLR